MNPYLNIQPETNERAEATVATEPIQHYPVSSQTELLNQVTPEPTSGEPGNCLPNFAVDEDNYLEKSEDQPRHDLVTVQGQATWPTSLSLPPTYENGTKLPRPTNPLIDAVAAHKVVGFESSLISKLFAK